jgi:hypothetical protein
VLVRSVLGKAEEIVSGVGRVRHALAV